MELHLSEVCYKATHTLKTKIYVNIISADKIMGDEEVWEKE
jgi:hypothetical protein